MYFHITIDIKTSPDLVFALLRDKHLVKQQPGSAVLLLEKTTSGAVGVGTCYREVVQMLPFLRGKIYSEITRFDPPHNLEEDFQGSGMYGHLAYELNEFQGFTRLVQRETLHAKGLLKVLEPFLATLLRPRLRSRLAAIRDLLEHGGYG